jgi:hypothetical protein
MSSPSSFDTYADKHPRTVERLNISPEQLRALFARPIAYNKLFAIAGGSVGAGVFLSQLVYWTETKEDPNEWIYKTRDDWWIETAIGRYELETIRKALVSRGLIEEKYYGVPPKLYYRVNWDQLSVAVAEAIQMHAERVSKRGAPTNQCLVRPVSASKPVATPPPSGGNATTKPAATPPDINRSESTSESTQRTKTTEISLHRIRPKGRFAEDYGFRHHRFPLCRLKKRGGNRINALSRLPLSLWKRCATWGQ